MRFEGKRVLVTGASSGIGRALALEFARRGADLVLCARRVEKLEEAAREIQSMGRKALALRCDVCLDGDVEAAVGAARREFGGLDVVVANAGFGVVGRVEDLSLDDFRRQLETNLFGVIRTVKASLPELRKTRGRLALMGSVSGYVSIQNTSPYSISKFGVRALADSLYLELSPCGVSVTLISPGFVESEIRKVDNRGRLHPHAPESVPRWIVMPVVKAARKIVRAVLRRRREIIITGHGRVVVFLHRHIPSVIRLAAHLGLRGRREPKE